MTDKQDIPEPPKSTLDPARPDAVGYGKPPEETLFKPGISGNPNGRPKGRASLAQSLRKTHSAKIMLTENGKIKSMPVLDAILKSTALKAMEGEVRATALLMTLMETHQVSMQPEQRRELQIRFITPDPAWVAKMERGE